MKGWYSTAWPAGAGAGFGFGVWCSESERVGHEGEREGERERERERGKERERGIEEEKEGGRQGEREKGREGERERGREGERERWIGRGGGVVADLRQATYSSNGDAVKFDPKEVLGPYGRTYEPTRHLQGYLAHKKQPPPLGPP